MRFFTHLTPKLDFKVIEGSRVPTCTHFHTIHNDMSWRQRCCCRFWGSCCEASWRRPAVSSSSHPKASGLEVLSNTTWWENWLICEAAAPWEINISMHLSHYSNHHVLTIHLAYCWIIITLGPFYLTKNLPPKLYFFPVVLRESLPFYEVSN